MEKQTLTQTEVMLLRHWYGANAQIIHQFESLNLDVETRKFILLTLVETAYKKGIKEGEKKNPPKRFGLW